METLESIEIVRMIGDVGFPMLITVYLLIRFEKKMESLEAVIEELSKVVANKK